MEKVDQTITAELSFEEAFSRLEDAVLKLENGGLSIDEMVERFSEGMSLIKVCYQKLDVAQAKVSILLREAEEVARVAVEDEAIVDEDDPM
ncbi:MAG TPA: exodeoxyribonuclease VII small subunit [Chloroflexota bacterium]|nr:exodeoxyribonuclease VII small subunit [Chloroflexota bacterium]